MINLCCLICSQLCVLLVFYYQKTATCREIFRMLALSPRNQRLYYSVFNLINSTRSWYDNVVTTSRILCYKVSMLKSQFLIVMHCLYLMHCILFVVARKSDAIIIYRIANQNKICSLFQLAYIFMSNDSCVICKAPNCFPSLWLILSTTLLAILQWNSWQK